MTRLEWLRKTPEYAGVYTRGKSVADSVLVVYFLAVQDQSGVKVGLSCSRKVGGAVVRNRARRRLREIFRRQVAQSMKPGYHLVVVVRRAAAGKSQAELRDSVHKLLGRAAVLVGN